MELDYRHAVRDSKGCKSGASHRAPRKGKLDIGSES